jgi:hypothetical protein
MDGEPPQEEDFSQIPLVERSQHKASRVICRLVVQICASRPHCDFRLEAHARIGKPEYQLTPMSSQSQPKRQATLTPFSDLLSRTANYCELTLSQPWKNVELTARRKWCLDANAVAQEKGIEAVLAIVQYSGESSAR